MTIVVDAAYQNGVLKPKEPIALSEGTEVRIAISTLDENDDPLEAVIGVCDDGPDISLAERHDEFVYGSMLLPDRLP
jgi:predicted DNA-binding antitoxin AbrB/MazE fold protein